MRSNKTDRERMYLNRAGGGLISPSGGLIWHFRALRYRANWADFINGLSEWLQSWGHGADGLLILGASAGWCLRSPFLAGFREIVAVDLDPLAPLIFGRRHGPIIKKAGTSISWIRCDAMQELDRLLKLFPTHSILFCNILGQLVLHTRDLIATEQYLQQLPRKLAGRNWATFHDRLSRQWVPGESVPQHFRKAGITSSLEVARLSRVHGVWEDHLTGEVLPRAVCRHYFAWPITSTRMHIIEAGFVESDSI